MLEKEPQGTKVQSLEGKSGLDTAPQAEGTVGAGTVKSCESSRGTP